MKNVKYIILGVLFSVIVTGCEKNDTSSEVPSTISDVRYESLPGAIKLEWTQQEPVTYEYIKITYFDHLKKKDMMRMASKYSDTIQIPGTREKYGTYTFSLQPFSKNGTPGEKLEIEAKSGPAPVTIEILDKKQIRLKAENLFTDAQEPSEGPIKDLIDGDPNTFFHAAWSVDMGPMPHYIVVKLDKKIDAFSFSYVTRNNAGAGNHPKRMNIYLSNHFDPENYDTSDLLLVDSLEDLPNGASQNFDSQNYFENIDEEYEYIWFEVLETHGGTSYFALAELSIFGLELDIVDPEAPE